MKTKYDTTDFCRCAVILRVPDLSTDFMFLLHVCALLTIAFGSHTASIKATDHGKEIHFHRVEHLFGKSIEYIHKGIVFFPSESNSFSLSGDSVGRPIMDSVAYVLHLWYPGRTKFRSRIRIDPVEAVLLGSAMEVIDDEPGALPADEAIARALSQLGQLPRGHRYNLAGNNCGNFVAWAKYGEAERDAQIWDELNKYASPYSSRRAAKLLRGFRRLTTKYYGRGDTGLYYV